MPSPAGSVALEVTHQSQVGEVRRLATTLASEMGFDQAGRSDLAIVVTEMATNLVRHADGGEMVFRRLFDPDGIEILALDKGRGIPDLPRAMEDGYSTAGGPGNGLGAIARLSHRFDIYSHADSGTAMLVQTWAGGPPARAKGQFEHGVVNLAVRGETAIGDGFAVCQRGGRAIFMLADGLGHGPLAAEGADEAVRIFSEDTSVPLDVPAFINRAHGALRKTRGAALAVAEVDPAAGQVRFAGVGNISGTLVRGDSYRHMISHNGTVGAEIRKIQDFQYPWAYGDLLIMCSDGLGTSWHLDKYPGLSHRHPSLIAGVLYRDYRRIRDDATVLVAKEIA